MSRTASWFPFYPSDYLGSTRRLTTLQHGAYLLLLLEQWQHGDLPDDDGELARIAGMRVDHWKRIAARIRAHFAAGEHPGTLRHPRLHAERLKAEELVAKRTEAANARWANKTTIGGSPTPQSDAPKSLKTKQIGDASADAHDPVCTSQPEPHPPSKNPGSLRSPAGKPPGRGRKPKQPGLALGDDRSPPDEPPACAAVKALFADGTPKLNAMVGGENRALIGQWLRDGADPGRVHALIREAHRRFLTPGEALDDPKAWIIWSLQAPPQRDGAVPEEVNGWVVAEVAAYCRRKAEVPAEQWPDLERVVYRALAAGADPDRHLYPVMAGFLRRNPNEIAMGLVVSAIKGTRATWKAAA